jgi:hypothetical protein
LPFTHHHSAIDFDYVARQPDHTLDIGLRDIHREPEDHRIAALDGADAEAVSEFVDEDALLIAQGGHHAGALHFDGLIDEDDQYDGDQDGQGQIAYPGYRVETARAAGGRSFRQGLGRERWLIVWHPARISLLRTL